MLLDEKEDKALSLRERELVVAYLIYARDDVRAISEVASHFLEMVIATLTDEAALDSLRQPAHPTPTH